MVSANASEGMSEKKVAKVASVMEGSPRREECCHH